MWSGITTQAKDVTARLSVKARISATKHRAQTKSLK
jgi:hypothetical protein